MFESFLGFLGSGISCIWILGLFKIDSTHWNAFFPGSVQYIRVLVGNVLEHNHIKSEALSEKDKTTSNFLKQIKDWGLKGSTDYSKSTHIWYSDLPPILKSVFDIVKNDDTVISLFRNLFKVTEYDYINLDGMNEIYVTGEDRLKEHTNSDQVFFISHTDGPFCFIPFISVYRCLVGLNENTSVTTHFPMIEDTYVLNRGDILAFDYNRDVHYITKDNDKQYDEPRVALKLHYCLYPKGWHMIGSIVGGIHVLYNSVLRSLFLKTIRPINIIDNIFSKLIVWTTHVVIYTDVLIGYRNIIYFTLIYFNTSGIIQQCMFNIPLLYKLLYVTFFQNECTHDIEMVSMFRDIIIFSSLYHVLQMLNV
jgi:hypothetical protein|tara:strand:+ start:1098 stop:2189 length:1092 start_codon:yes stop_codon:yes gene_type:complete